MGPNRWQLPLRYELQALVNYGSSATVGLDPPFNPDPATTLVWTGTPLAGDEFGTAWVVDLRDGTVQRRGKGSTEPRVLCVEE